MLKTPIKLVDSSSLNRLSNSVNIASDMRIAVNDGYILKYKHLSYSDRQEMEKLYLQGWHMNDIAAKLGVSLATVYHERARGDTGKMDKNGRGGYSAELAQSKIYARRQELQERH